MAALEPFQRDGVQGFLHRPNEPESIGLVLTHGAGANCEAVLLVRLAAAFCEHGVAVLRCDLPFRQKRRFGPPHPSTAEADRQGLRAAVAALRNMLDVPIALGGHSYGGRQASILAAEEPGWADTLLLLSYPLHPPGRRDQLRSQHFPHLRTPALFVSGTEDAFASPSELREATATIPSRVERIFIENAGHDLQPKCLDVQQYVVRPFLTFFSGPVDAVP